MKCFGKTGNRVVLFFLAGTFFLVVLSYLIMFEGSNTGNKVVAADMDLDQRYASLASFRQLVRAVEQCNRNIQDNTSALQDLKKQIKNDSYTMSRIIKENAQRCKKLEDKLTYELEPKVRKIEKALAAVAQRLPRQGY